MTAEQIYNSMQPSFIVGAIYNHATQEKRNITLDEFHRVAEQIIRTRSVIKRGNQIQKFQKLVKS